MPARFADRFDVNADWDAVQGSLLAAVPGRHLDLVLLLVVIAQLLCVPDVTWCGGKESLNGKFNPKSHTSTKDEHILNTMPQIAVL